MGSSIRVRHANDRTTELGIVLAASSIAAGVIHAAAAQEHLEEAAVFGLFFILTAGFQVAWAAWVLVWPTTIVYAIGALTNGAIIGIWVISRTIGLPVGPDPWMPEGIHALDVAATSLELVIVLGAGGLLWRRASAAVGHARCSSAGNPRRRTSARTTASLRSVSRAA